MSKTRGRVSCRNIFIAYKDGKKFIGNAAECAKLVGSKAGNIRKVADGGFINGYLIKQVTTVVIIYCVDTPDGKHYESESESELQKYVWYAPASIARYCYQNFVLGDGTRFYCRKEYRDFEAAVERIIYKG